MKPAPFEYFAPDSLEELLDLLQQYGDECKLIAGGQSLGPLLNMRLSMPTVLIDMGRLRSLDFQRNGNGVWTIGATLRQSTLEDDTTLALRQPLVAATVPYIGHRAIRNRGTVGGSIAHADPAAEWPALAVLLDAEIVAQRAGAEPRVISAENFFVGPMMTTLEPEEALIELRLPWWPSAAGWAIQEFSQRHNDFAVIGVLARMLLGADRRVTDVRIALMGAGPTPLRARQAEALLIGERSLPERLAAAAYAASAEIDPDGDVLASADYRRHLTHVLVERALQEAAQRAEAAHD